MRIDYKDGGNGHLDLGFDGTVQVRLSVDDCLHLDGIVRMHLERTKFLVGVGVLKASNTPPPNQAVAPVLQLVQKPPEEPEPPALPPEGEPDGAG